MLAAGLVSSNLSNSNNALISSANLRICIKPFQAHITGTPEVLEEAHLFLVSQLKHSDGDNLFSLHNARHSKGPR